jgi:hypothetical protein
LFHYTHIHITFKIRRTHKKMGANLKNKREMKEQQLQQAKDWLAQNNYDDNQYVFLNGNSPHGVNKEGQPLESVLANYLLEKEKEK